MLLWPVPIILHTHTRRYKMIYTNFFVADSSRHPYSTLLDVLPALGFTSKQPREQAGSLHEVTTFAEDIIIDWQHRRLAQKRAKVHCFLKSNGFHNANSPRASLLWVTYPLHEAVKQKKVSLGGFGDGLDGFGEANTARKEESTSCVHFFGGAKARSLQLAAGSVSTLVACFPARLTQRTIFKWLRIFNEIARWMRSQNWPGRGTGTLLILFRDGNWDGDHPTSLFWRPLGCSLDYSSLDPSYRFIASDYRIAR